ncbi:metal ABC transporter substrate-binding protein [Aureimonas fodinaquatilis]|uniref:Metal ABC transporter substrate-binding protein n=1 Tax=Aureimonas fodinaquatilis TaxID=2565783 RepID=A0A5B0DV07_9HYPH|nr:zinc ABC transporter substrate-binding protein [Aureimonas fodinaquatilis]KAA0970647.1 metal ABC transporter substrate-binding protein [Aureimonas fodinaquatilis]
MRISYRMTAAVSALALFSVSTGSARAEQLNVLASFSIIADLAANVGGEHVSITTLVGPNGDAHVYEPRPADAAAMANADVVLTNGLQFEGFIPRLVQASGTKAPIVELTKGGEMLKGADDHDDHGHGHEGHHHHGEFDPHAWQSVPNASVYVKNIVEAFCAADASSCDVFRTNGEAYLQELAALDAEIHASLSQIPEARRIAITSHDAFGYFAHEYGVTFLAAESVSTESEVSAAEIAQLITLAREKHATAIFVENITNPRLIEQIAAETGIQVGGTLYSDALSDANGPAATYVEMMRFNAQQMANAMRGQ